MGSGPSNDNAKLVISFARTGQAHHQLMLALKDPSRQYDIVKAPSMKRRIAGNPACSR
jgi:hypothetical protein